MQVKLLTDTALPPQMAHPTDVAYDLYADQDIFLTKGSQAVVSTGIAIALPHNCAGILKSRSGLSVKHGINVGAGVIDTGYRGEVKVLIQATQESFHITKGDRIAQLLLVPIERSQVEIVDILDTTDRGDGGFGSTGTNKLDLEKANQEI